MYDNVGLLLQIYTIERIKLSLSPTPPSSKTELKKTEGELVHIS